MSCSCRPRHTYLLYVLRSVLNAWFCNVWNRNHTGPKWAPPCHVGTTILCYGHCTNNQRYTVAHSDPRRVPSTSCFHDEHCSIFAPLCSSRYTAIHTRQSTTTRLSRICISVLTSTYRCRTASHVVSIMTHSAKWNKCFRPLQSMEKYLAARRHLRTQPRCRRLPSDLDVGWGRSKT